MLNKEKLGMTGRNSTQRTHIWTDNRNNQILRNTEGNFLSRRQKTTVSRYITPRQLGEDGSRHDGHWTRNSSTQLPSRRVTWGRIFKG